MNNEIFETSLLGGDFESYEVVWGKVAIGIEIDDFEIRAVELQKKNGEIYLLGYDRILLPRYCKEWNDFRSEDLTVCLKKLWTRNKFTKKEYYCRLIKS